MTPDVNVLVAASRSDHLHHPVAIRWLDDALDACALGQGLGLMPMVAPDRTPRVRPGIPRLGRTRQPRSAHRWPQRPAGGAPAALAAAHPCPLGLARAGVTPLGRGRALPRNHALARMIQS